MKTFPTNNANFLSLDCPFCYHGKVEIVERSLNIAKQLYMKTIGVKFCPICQGNGYYVLTQH
jgi:hypothetical protein